MEVSVVIPTYNRKGYLQKALDALLKQSYPRDKYEIIVADDYSTDGTPEAMESIARNTDVRISYYANTKAKGQTFARNMGLQKAQGAFIASTDDDIEVGADWLAKGLGYFKSPEILAVEGRIVAKDAKNEPFYHNLSMDGGTYGTGNIFYRRTALEAAGWLDENLNKWHNYGSHYVLGLRILESGGKIFYASDLVAYHVSYKMKSSTIIKNSLKSGAIAYLYKTYGVRIVPYLGFRLQRIVISFFFLSFIVAIILSNYLVMLISLVLWLAAVSKFVPDFLRAGAVARFKILIVYSLSYLIATFVFLYGCIRYKVFPSIRMIRR